MNIGVIGAKSKHLRFFQQALAALPDSRNARISAVCCCDAPELRSVLYDLTVFEMPEALIDASDAVIIALRDGTQHAALSKLCVDAGKPVFVDKPFTCDVREAEQLCVYAQSGIVTGGSTLSMTPIVRSLASSLPRCSHYTLSYMAHPMADGTFTAAI